MINTEFDDVFVNPQMLNNQGRATYTHINKLVQHSFS